MLNSAMIDLFRGIPLGNTIYGSHIHNTFICGGPSHRSHTQYNRKRRHMPKPRRQFYPQGYRKYLSVHTVSDTADMDDSCDTGDSRHHGGTDFP